MPSVIRGSDNFDSAGGNAVKAWVNFNGTGTVAIRASFNVSSITDNGVGDYTVNFATAMSDANFAVTLAHVHAASWSNLYIAPIAYSTTSVQINNIEGTTPAKTDSAYIHVGVFR